MVEATSEEKFDLAVIHLLFIVNIKRSGKMTKTKDLNCFSKLVP